MTNEIEIRVKAVNETASGLDEAKVSAKEAGQLAGEEFSSSFASGASSVSEKAYLTGSEISQMISVGIASGIPEVEAQVQELMAGLPATIDPEVKYAGGYVGDELMAAFLAAVEGGASGDSVASAVVSMGESAQPAAAEAGTTLGTVFSQTLTESATVSMDAFFSSGLGPGVAMMEHDLEAQAAVIGENFGAVFSSKATKGLEDATSRANFIAGGLPSELDKTAASADKAAGSMGGLGSVLMGPVGYGLFSLAYFLPMIGGLFSSGAVSASVFTQAVQQDSNAVGDNTAKVIAQTLAKSDLSAISSQLGLSQAQLIEYAAGEANVQQQVVQAYQAKLKALQETEQAQGRVTAGRSGANATDPTAVSISQLQQQKAALDQVAQAVAVSIQQSAEQSSALYAAEQTNQIYSAAVRAVAASQLLNAQNTLISNQATAQFGSQVLAVESTVQYMTNAMHAANITLQQQTLLSAENSVGLLNLGTSQNSLNQSLVLGETAYSQSTQEANAYGTALTSLNGDTVTLLGSEASFTTSLNSLTTSIKTNGDSLDVNTAKGAANVQTVIAIANAADKAAVAVYQNEVNTKGSTLAYEDANAKLQQEKTAFENQAIAAGMSKDKVKQLADELFQLPSAKDIPINVNTQPAMNGLAEVINRINSSSGTVTIYETPSGTVFSSGGGNKAKAVGGPSSGYAATGGARYANTVMNEYGPEAVNLPNGSMVVPAANTAALMEQMGVGFGGGGKLVVEWVGGNSADKLFELFRENIRFKYGSDPQSVQKALGQNY